MLLEDLPNLAIAFVIFFIIFGTLERLFPLHPQKVFRPGWFTDVTHYFVTNVLGKIGLFISVSILTLAFASLFKTELVTWVHLQPLYLQFFEAIIVSDIAGYWVHRWMHTNMFLWRFHKIHHSSRQLDWLASVRFHPFDQVFIRSGQFLALSLLGFSGETLGAYLIFAIFQAIFIHANVKINFGFLKYVISTPEFHHWHHSALRSEYNSNYGFFPWTDWMFGTLYLPQDKRPTEYGIKEEISNNYIAQLVTPFKDGVKALPAPKQEIQSPGQGQGV